MRWKHIVAQEWFMPSIVAALGIWRIFVPQLEANEGLGWDGLKYYDIAVNGLQSKVLDNYLVLRMLPSLYVHTIFLVFGIAFTPPNVILAFKLMHTVLLTVAAWMVKRIFDKYNLNALEQITGFCLVFLNYGALNFTYYYPVMTDTPAFVLSIALIYFYIYNDVPGMALTGLLGAFTWPLLFPMSVALLFSSSSHKTEQIHPAIFWGGRLISFFYAVAVCWYFVVYLAKETDDAYTLPISRAWLPLSLILTGVLFFFFPDVLMHKHFYSKNSLSAVLDKNRILWALSAIIFFVFLKWLLPVNNPSKFLKFSTQVNITMVYALQRPLIGLVSHFNYWGAAVLIGVIYWRSITAFWARFGLGFNFFIFFSLIMFFAQAESRRLAYIFPWILLGVALFVHERKFHAFFHIVLISINFLLAKLWLFPDRSKQSALLPDGTVGFPEQWFFMHLGRWMTEEVWMWLCVIFMVCAVVLLITDYFSKRKLTQSSECA
ncbi:MAG: hypothetical protein RMJ53_06355 [Chitinophagales bacterium]|nr:hypothetical protein [Chitinophagales bacterium]